MKYLKGNVYTNIMTSSVADLVGTALSAIFYDRFGVRAAFLLCLVFSIMGGTAILLFNYFTGWMPLFILFAKLGVSSTFNLVFLANADLFPTLFSATAIGICNFFARLSTTAAPLIAERPEPLPMILYLIANFGAVYCASQLRSKPKALREV